MDPFACSAGAEAVWLGWAETATRANRLPALWAQAAGAPDCAQQLLPAEGSRVET